MKNNNEGLQTVKSRKVKSSLGLAAGILLLLVCASAVSFCMWQLQIYASGNDIWGHLYKSQLMYDSIKQGDAYPLYTSLWYNGVQPYRYWAPLPYYLMTLLQMIAAGNIEIAYYLFAGVSVFLGGIPWMLLGKKNGRVSVGITLALIWFFMPENIRVFLCEGNLPRMVTAILIPWLVYFIWKALREKKSRAYAGIVAVTAAIVLSHAMIGAMVGIGTFLFLLFDCKKNRSIRQGIQILLSMLAGIALAGIWLIPALSGGLVSMGAESSSTVMEALMYSLSSTLNPVNRFTGIIDTFYYGLSVVIISVIGIALSDKRNKSGYIVALLVLIATTPALLPILKKLPMSQLFWMMRFATIIYGFFFFSFIEWKKLRRGVCIVFIALLVADCLPSLMFTRYDTSESPLTAEDVKEVKALTKQRTAIMDLSTFGSYPSWELCTGDDAVDYTYGWAWQGAATSSNIVLLNTALESENYSYLFDRCLELGNDTVLIKKDAIGTNGKTEADMINGAMESGYLLEKETNQSYLFALENAADSFGVKTAYTGIGIGSYANTASLYYPSFTIGKSQYLDDYTAEDLQQYQTIFLSGFLYHNQEAAEKLVEELGDAGSRVVIDMTHIPASQTTKRQTFLDVTAEEIVLEDNFPDTYYRNEQIMCKEFGESYETWNTSYLYGVKNVSGYMKYSGKELPFAGYNDNRNITFLGMNFMFHATETLDMNAFSVMDNLLNAEYMTLPQRETVPMTITYTADSIHIQTDETDVNTTLAYQDNFESEDSILNQNNMLLVEEKDTTIQLVYPQFRKGLMVSMIGLAAGIVIIGADYGHKRKKEKADR